MGKHGFGFGKGERNQPPDRRSRGCRRWGISDV